VGIFISLCSVSICSNFIMPIFDPFPGNSYPYIRDSYRFSGNSYRFSGNSDQYSRNSYRHPGNSYRHLRNSDRHPGNSYRHLRDSDRHPGNSYQHLRYVNCFFRYVSRFTDFAFQNQVQNKCIGGVIDLSVRLN
jgi:hypothetical protein